MRLRTIVCWSLLSFILALTASAQTVYVYKDKKGNSLISNRMSQDSTLTLVKTYVPVRPIETLGAQHYNLATRKLDPRTTQFDETIFSLADTFQQDRALIKAIIQVESSFNPRALSPMGAQGLMQLMPATANSYNVNNPFDIDDNLRGGIAFFAYLMKRYHNDIRLALAAYNAGETAVSRHNGVPPFAETQAYVKYVLRLHKSYQKYANTYS